MYKRDLTSQQAVKQLQALFPERSCYISYNAWAFSHYPRSREPEVKKTLYVEGIEELERGGGIGGGTFKTLLRMATLIKEQRDYEAHNETL